MAKIIAILLVFLLGAYGSTFIFNNTYLYKNYSVFYLSYFEISLTLFVQKLAAPTEIMNLESNLNFKSLI